VPRLEVVQVRLQPVALLRKLGSRLLDLRLCADSAAAHLVEILLQHVELLLEEGGAAQ